MRPLLCILRHTGRRGKGGDMAQLAKEVAREIEPLVEQEGLELVHVEYVTQSGSRMLRVLVDKEGGITVDDCQKISELIGPALDASSLLRMRYVLEVSSPGFDRPLTKEKDFIRFAGQPVKIRTHSPIDGKRTLSGKLQGLNGSDVVLDVDGSELRIPVPEMASARLDL
jgi:ribosome maturation factor RimP